MPATIADWLPLIRAILPNAQRGNNTNAFLAVIAVCNRLLLLPQLANHLVCRDFAGQYRNRQA
jgi:hypothetical protein